MIEFEEHLRSELRAASEGRPDGVGLSEKIEDLMRRRERRERGQRVALIAATVVLAVVAGAVATQGGGDQADLAASPRDGAPGWKELSPAPIPERFQHTSVDIGGRALIFGGYGTARPATGAAIYDPATGTWAKIADPPGDMSSAVAVWTGSDVLALDAGGQLYSYAPDRDEWSERAPSPLASSGNAVTAVAWTGELLVGLHTSGGDPNGLAARPIVYDPRTDTWESYDAHEVDSAFTDAIWTGEDVVMAGTTGASGSKHPSIRVASWSPEDGWRDLPTPPLDQPGSRTVGFTTWTGTEVVVGGGMTWSDEAVALAKSLSEENRDPTPQQLEILQPRPAVDAVAWNPKSGEWRRFADAPVPMTGLMRYTDVWTGQEVVAWEMSAEDPYVLTGGLVLLDPAAGTWRRAAAPDSGFHQEAPVTWTGHELIIFSGEPTSTDPESGQCCKPVGMALSFTP